LRQVILFGGTFDPPHIGHLLMAQLALEQTGADALWFIPAAAPPHKMTVTPRDFEWRAKMVERLIQGFDRMIVDRIEVHLERPSYTVRTVRALQEAHPDVCFRFLMGADSLAQLPTWHAAAELAERVSFVVAHRTGYPIGSALSEVRRWLPHIRVDALEMPLVDVSSSWLRERRRAGLPLCGLVPQAVLEVWEAGPDGEAETGSGKKGEEA
jgi:nicotinate-nucleotide adenylyltransferase